MCASRMFASMLVDSIHFQCVNVCKQDLTRLMILIEPSRFTPRQNKTTIFENMVVSFLKPMRLNCKIERSVTTGRQILVPASVLLCFFFIAPLSLTLQDAFSTFLPDTKNARLSLKKIFIVVLKRDNLIV